MSDAPLVSVIIPAHNAERTIRNAVESVLRQTVSDLEVIVVDDASTDGTAGAVGRIHDSRVRLLVTEHNLRQAAARNLAMKCAKGKWVAFLDADDEWVADRLEFLIGAVVGTPTGFIVDLTAKSVPGPGGRLVPIAHPDAPQRMSTEEFGLTEYLNLAMDVKPMVLREVLLRQGIEFPEWGSCGDWLFLIASLSANGVRGRLVRRVGYLYRTTGRHDSSTLRGIEEQLKVQQFLVEDTRIPEGTRERLRQGVKGIRSRLVVAALRERRWRKFMYYARQNPSDCLIVPASVLRFAWRKIRYGIVS
jgi:succinoglycan biosynthesis protein ExoO